MFIQNLVNWYALVHLFHLIPRLVIINISLPKLKFLTNIRTKRQSNQNLTSSITKKEELVLNFVFLLVVVVILFILILIQINPGPEGRNRSFKASSTATSCH
jgi:p-aminobenzoyl-glutamate transporter AbgT